LDTSGLRYERNHFVCGISEPWLQGKYGLRDRISVPLLTCHDAVVHGGMQIVEFVNDLEECREALFNPADLEVIRRWDRLSSDMLDYGRRILIERMEVDERLLLPHFSTPLRALPLIGLPVGRRMSADFREKYKHVTESASSNKARAALQQLRAALESGNGLYLLGDRFSYVDITAASGTHVFEPLRLPAAEKISGLDHIDIIDEFPEVLAWRSELIKKHYPFKPAQ